MNEYLAGLFLLGFALGYLTRVAIGLWGKIREDKDKGEE
jgi:hypothetical protein